MKKSIRLKLLIIFILFVLVIANFSMASTPNFNKLDINNTWGNDRFHYVESITIPEQDIELNVKNLVRGVDIYILIPVEMFNYNLQRFIDLNIDNRFDVEKTKAEQLKQFVDHNKVLEYIEYLRKEGYQVDDNTIEIRHYSICMNDLEVIGFYNLENTEYVQVKLDFSKTSTFKLILKDYLTDYDLSNFKFFVDDGGDPVYINVSDYSKVVDEEKPNISKYVIDYQYFSDEDYVRFNRDVGIGYLILMIIVLIILLLIVIGLIRRAIKNYKEKQARLFYKKKLTKEEKKELKEKKKQEKLEEKKNRKHKRR